MKRKVKPVGEMVLLKAIRQDMTEGGVVLPDSAKAKKSLGHIVLARGEEVDLCEVGDTVIMHGNGAFITMDGIDEDLFLVKQDQILGILYEDEDEI